MSGITPTTEVQIWNFNDECVPIKIITLGAWKILLKSEAAGRAVREPIAPMVREFLSAPADFPIQDLSDHITTSYDGLMEMFETGEFNYEPIAGSDEE